MIKMKLYHSFGNYTNKGSSFLCDKFVEKFFKIKSQIIEMRISNTKFKDSKGIYVKSIMNYTFERMVCFWSIAGTFKDVFCDDVNDFTTGLGNETFANLSNLLTEHYEIQDNEIYFFYISIKPAK